MESTAETEGFAGQRMVSIIIPAQNEAENLTGLIPEIVAALAGESFEIVLVDDASTDNTPGIATSLMKAHPQLRMLRNEPAAGKSGAIWVGVGCAQGEFAITVDGDGQNDPRFLKPMLDLLRSADDVGLVCGQRLKRGDGFLKLVASRIANRARRALLGDATRDTACGLKAFRIAAFRRLPYFETLHRFLPALMAADGWQVAHLDVIDRERRFGQSKYGIWDRLSVGIPDLFGVWWLIRRRRRFSGVATNQVR